MIKGNLLENKEDKNEYSSHFPCGNMSFYINRDTITAFGSKLVNKTCVRSISINEVAK